MKAAIVSVGTELTSGEIIDTNSAFLARELAALGMATRLHVSVGDDEDDLVDAVASAAALAEIVLVTGGIGPTPDDITRQALACAAGVPLVRNEEVLDHIRGMFSSWGREMSENNAIQADFPEGSTIIANPRGTAAGFNVKIAGAQVIVMPGVPGEMKLMWNETVRDFLRRLADGGIIVTGTVDCFGLGESDITQKIGDLMAPGLNPSVGDTAEDGVIRVRIRAHAETQDEALQMVAAVKRDVCSRLGDVVFGEDGATLEGAVVRALLERNLTLSIAESCTGGLLAGRITDVPGASGCFMEGVVAYHNAAKTRLLGVREALIAENGAVSREVALAMADGMRKRAGTDFAISTTGIAGPSGGTPHKPVGLVFAAVSSPGGTKCRRLELRGDRGQVRDRACKIALNMLRLEIFSE